MTRSSTSTFSAGAALRRAVDILLPLVFLGGIVAVLILTRWNVARGGFDELEMRPTVALPTLQIRDIGHFFPRFYRFFDENFGLRLWAIRQRSRLWLSLLSLHPSEDPAFSTNVYPGKNDWLFYASNRLPADILHVDPLSQAELASWREGIAERRQWAAHRGIRYLFVLTPDKRTIYPEMLPAFFQRQRPGLTRRQQLDRALAGDPAFLDLAGPVRDAKSSGRLYYRWDTHWNRLGAYFGYVAMMRRLGIPALSRDLGRPEQVANHYGDLGRMIGFELLDRDTAPVATCPKPATGADAAAVAGLRGADILYAEAPTVCGAAAGRLLMFHDSFASMWQPYLSSQFGFAAYAWTEPSFTEFKRLAEEVHPTVIIEQRVERLLILPLR